MEMPDDVKRTWRAKWLRLYGVYVPTMIAIPCMLEFADMTALFAHKADKVTMLLTAVDCYTVGMSFMLYFFLKKMVSRVEYDTETQKVMVRQEFGSEYLTVKESEYGPKELEKYVGKARYNKTIGYRSIRKGDYHMKFGTENEKVIWHDRKLFDTVISQPGERLKDMKVRKNWRASKKNKKLPMD